MEKKIVVMNAEDAAFLAALKRTLLTQPTDGNRDPRFWGIIETKKEYGYQEEYADGWIVYDYDNQVEVGESNNIQSVVRELVDPEEYNLGTETDYANMDIDDVVRKANELYADGNVHFEATYYRNMHLVNRDAIFLTKSACQQHIDRYAYSYEQPHTYVMTASRCPEYEKLLEILKYTDWE